MSRGKIKIHSVKYNFFMNIILKTSTFIFPLITFPYVSRILGPGPNGDISFATSVISYFSLLAGMGIPSYGVRKCAENRDDINKLSKIIQELLIINIIFTVISYIILICMVIFIPKFSDNASLLYIMSITIIFSTFGVDWVYQAIEQYDYITVRNISFKIVAVILMFVFVHKPSDYVIYAGITVFGNVGSNILNLLKLPHFVTFKRYEVYNLKQHMNPIVMLFLYNATTTIFTNLDQVMLGFMSNSKEVGYYAATVKIKNILASLITSLGAVMLPRMSYYLGKGDKKKFSSLVRKSFNFIFISAIPVTMYFFIEAKPIIGFLAGPKYYNSVSILRNVLPSIFFIGLSSVTAWQLLIPLKLEKYTVVGSIFGAIINVVFNMLLIPIVGGNGAAFATTVAELCVLLTHLIVLRKRIVESKLIDSNEFIKAIVAAVVATLMLILFNSKVIFSNLLVDCVVTGFIYFVIYIVILLILKENILIGEMKKFLSNNNIGG